MEADKDIWIKREVFLKDIGVNPKEYKFKELKKDGEKVVIYLEEKESMSLERKKEIKLRIKKICETIINSAESFCRDSHSNFLAVREKIRSGEMSLEDSNKEWAMKFIKDLLRNPKDYSLYDDSFPKKRP